jgi:hypothetical protein
MTDKLAKVSSGGMEPIPEHLRRPAGQPKAGFEEVEQSEIVFPRLKVCQALTPERDDSEPKYIPDLQEGQYFNSMTGKIYGNKIIVVPLLKFNNRILFRPKNDGGGILCRADDNKNGVGEPGGKCLTCPMAKFGSSTDEKGNPGKGTACTEYFNFPSIVIEDGKLHPENMLIASFKSSDIPEAKQWIGRMNLKPIDMFGGIYELTTKKKKFAKGTSFVQIVRNAGMVSVEMLETAKSVYEMFHRMRVEGRLKADESREADPATEFNPDDIEAEGHTVEEEGKAS